MVEIIEAKEFYARARHKWRTSEKPAPNGVKMFDRRLDLTDEDICEECKSPLRISTIPIIQNEGVGQTFAQEHVRSFSVQYDIVCSKCGLVHGKTTREITQY